MGFGGAGLSTNGKPRSRAVRAAADTASSGTSRPARTTARPPGTLPTASATCAAVTSMFAPEATPMRFSPPASTRISATPVGSVPSERRTRRPRRPPRGRPGLTPEVVVRRRARPAPHGHRRRAAAEAWLAPFPPPPRWIRPVQHRLAGRGQSRQPDHRGRRSRSPLTTTTGRSGPARCLGSAIRRSLRSAFRRREERPEDGGFGGRASALWGHVDPWQRCAGNAVPSPPVVAGEPGLARCGLVDLRDRRGVRPDRPRARLTPARSVVPPAHRNDLPASPRRRTSRSSARTPARPCRSRRGPTCSERRARPAAG